VGPAWLGPRGEILIFNKQRCHVDPRKMKKEMRKKKREWKKKEKEKRDEERENINDEL